jgi:hypothetical protein
MPDIHGAEMGTRRILISDAVNDGHGPLVPKVLHGSHGRMKAVIVVQMNDLVLWDADGGSIVPVERVIVRDDGIEIIVTAGDLQNNQDWVLLVSHVCVLLFSSFC